VIVVDTNVVAGLFLPSDWTEKTEQLLATDPEWAAPLLWRSEFRNILATYVRSDRLDLETALHIAETAEALFAGREFSVDSAAVLRLAAQSRCTAYDTEYVALAQHLGTRLVTLDRQVLEAFPAVATDLDAVGG
jgi:predicted nucleic acid-binding protein